MGKIKIILSNNNGDEFFVEVDFSFDNLNKISAMPRLQDFKNDVTAFLDVANSRNVELTRITENNFNPAINLLLESYINRNSQEEETTNA